MRMAMAAVLLVACGGGEAAEMEPLTGPPWTEWIGGLLSQDIELHDGGRYERHLFMGGTVEAGVWSTEGDILRLTPDGMIPWPDLRWEIHGKQLTVWWPPMDRHDYTRR